MACGKTHEKVKDAIEDVRHALIHALENREEDVVGKLYDVYGDLRKISASNISTNSTFMSMGLGDTNVNIDTSNYDASLYTNAASAATNASGYVGQDYISFGGDTTISGGSDTISFT
jgi:hypothetical protein